MTINVFWYLCLLVRFTIFLFLIFVSNLKRKIVILDNITFLFLLLIGIGFLYKFLTGSNNEYQKAKVFWHETRIIHSILFLLASISYLFNFKKIAPLFILIDILFSFLYRLITNQ